MPHDAEKHFLHDLPAEEAMERAWGWRSLLVL